MLNVLYTECLHYAVLFHSDDEMFLLLQNVLQWDVDSITLQKIAFLSAYYALPPIVQFNRLILSNEAFTLLHKSSFTSDPSKGNQLAQTNHPKPHRTLSNCSIVSPLLVSFSSASKPGFDFLPKRFERESRNGVG